MLPIAAADRMMANHPVGFGDADFVIHGNSFVTYALARPMQDLFFVGDLPRLTVGFPATAVDQAVLPVSASEDTAESKPSIARST